MNSINVFEYLQSPFWVIQFIIFSALFFLSFKIDVLDKYSIVVNIANFAFICVFILSNIYCFWILQEQSFTFLDSSDQIMNKYVIEGNVLYVSFSFLSFFVFGRFGLVYGFISLFICLITTTIFGVATWPYELSK